MLNIYLPFDLFNQNSGIYSSTKRMHQYEMGISIIIEYVHIIIKNKKHLKCSSLCKQI